MAGKWVRDIYGGLVSLDKIESIGIAGTKTGAEVRAYLPGGDPEVGYFVLFAHDDGAVCEEWLNVFAREHLDVVPPVVLLSECPHCKGTGDEPGTDPQDLPEPCCLCGGGGEVTLSVYEETMTKPEDAPASS